MKQKNTAFEHGTVLIFIAGCLWGSIGLLISVSCCIVISKLSLGATAPLGCVIFFAFVEIAFIPPAHRYQNGAFIVFMVRQLLP